MMRARRHLESALAERSGFTLIELLIGAIVFSIIVAISMDFFRVENIAFREGTERADATQNLLYSLTTLGRNLRTAGTNVAPGQPFLVYADTDVVAFNADYATNVANDPFAVYYEANAPAAAVTALRRAAQITIPETTFLYPDTDYTAAGVNSPAETIIFFFASDTSTARTDDYVLYRQVNDQAPEEVARNLLHLGSDPFFQYMRLTGSTGDSLVDVPVSDLPLKHSVAIHGSPGDTALFAQIDSVRGVRVRLAASNGRTGAAQQIQGASRLIWLRNAGETALKTCGSPPIFNQAVTATVQVVDSIPQVTISWNPSVDEKSGEKDVIRYVVWRDTVPGSPSQDPFLSIPAGSPSYSYTDQTVKSGKKYTYSVAAQDCTPSLSPQVTTGTVTIP